MCGPAAFQAWRGQSLTATPFFRVPAPAPCIGTGEVKGEGWLKEEPLPQGHPGAGGQRVRVRGQRTRLCKNYRQLRTEHCGHCSFFL